MKDKKPTPPYLEIKQGTSIDEIAQFIDTHMEKNAPTTFFTEAGAIDVSGTEGGNGSMVETGRIDSSKPNQANKPKGETSMPLEVDTLQAGDVVRYYNFDGEFKIDEGVVNEDNIYKDGVEVHGDGWKQYVGKWFIDEVIRDNKTIFKKEANKNE